MAKTIEAKLRIATEVAQALADLKAVRKAVADTTADARRSTQGAAAGTAADPVVRQVRERTTVERQAAREAAQAERDRVRAQREAAAESKRIADAEKRRKDKELADEKKRQRELSDAQSKQDRFKAYQTAALAPQLTDIGVGLATGQSPLTVALQQGGQLRDLYGGVGNALRALGALLTPVRVGIGLVGAAIGTLAFQAAKGYAETDRLNKALALTGNPTGTSLGQLDTLARRIAATTQSSIADVRETLAELVSAGTQGALTLDSTARAVTAYRKITGASADEAVKLFAGQRDAVLDWATKANKAYSFLTAAQLGYIRTLQAQGRADEAVKFANEQLAATLEQRAAPAIGAIERAWKAVGTAVADVLDKLKAIGRAETIDDQIVALERRVEASARIRQNLALRGQPVPGPSPEEQRTERELKELRIRRDRQQQAARERAEAQKAEQAQAVKDGRSYQDALAAVERAGVQKRLAERLAALDREQSTVEQTRADDVFEEQERAEALNRIEALRLEAQRDALNAEIAIAKRRIVERPEDTLTNSAAVAELESQLVGLESRLEQVRAKAGDAGKAAQKKLADEAAAQSAEWEKAWKDAAQRITEFSADNAAAAAERLPDPAARAAEAARLATAAQQRELERTQRALRLRIDLTVDPQQRAELQRQLDTLTTEATRALNERSRQARFQSLQQQLAEEAERLALQEQELAALQERGAITAEQAEERKLNARAGSQAQLERILELLRQTAATGSAADQAVVQRATATVRDLTDLRGELERTARNTGISELAQGLTDLQTGAGEAGNALRNMVAGFARAMLEVLNRRLATQLVDQFLDAASGFGGGGGGGGFFSSIGGFLAGLFHTGGVVGQGAGGMVRAVSPAVFAGAQVLHSGGVAGLRAGETPAILMKGEEVLTEDDPRHVRNLGRGQPMIGNLNVSVSTDGTGSTSGDAALADGLKRVIADKVVEGLREQMRPGGLLEAARGRV